MALIGVHVTCGYMGGQGVGSEFYSLLGSAVWSETMGVAGTTVNSAPRSNTNQGLAVFSVRCSAAIYFTVGAPPADPSLARLDAGGRRYLDVGEDIDVYAPAGSKLAWVFA